MNLRVNRLHIWFVALAAMAIVAVACTNSGPEPTSTSRVGPTATPTVGASSDPVASDPTATAIVAAPTASGGVSPELAEFLSEVDRRMAEIRGIPVADPVPYRFLNKEELNAYVREEINDPEVIEDIDQADALYTLLGLISPDADLFEEYTALLDSQVLGAYDPEDEEFVVLQPGDEFGPSQEFTYAHEYIHRLQDARYGLDEITESLEDNSDRSLAFTALVEGDATTAQQQYALRHFDLNDLSRILSESQAAADGLPQAPYILQRGLEFPYIEGATFVDSLRTTQGVQALEDAFHDPPDSTEQILHIEKYVNGELPHEVSLPDVLFDVAGPVGSGWTVLNEDVLGEFFLRSWLEAIGSRSSDAAEAAAGWGGDAMVLAQDADGDHALAIKITWDDPSQDAEQFSTLLTTIMAASPDFRRVNVGAEVGVRAYESGDGVIVTATFNSPADGDFTIVTAADTIDDAMPLALALVE